MRRTTIVAAGGVLVIMGFLAAAFRSQARVAHIARDAQGNYEIRLNTSELSFGGPCNFPSMPHRIQGADWIHSKTTNGVVEADQLTLVHNKDPESQWKQQALRGTVTFSRDHLRVAFQVPIFDQKDTIVGYEPYQHNGDWRLNGQ